MSIYTYAVFTASFMRIIFMEVYMEYKHFSYKGPVTNSFGRLLTDKWEGATMAPTLAKARSNLGYQFKKESNLLPSSKVIFNGPIKEN